MGTIWIREFTGGLDTRRLPETTPGGVLIQAQDGHITRGGEFEQRAAFVTSYVLPAGTVGLAYSQLGIYVFGSDPDPGVPPGIFYQQLVHPTGQQLVEVPSFDRYAGKIYAVGVFEDGSVFHYYDGVLVADWYDGRARAAFQVTGGGVTPAVAASGSFEITGGSSGAGNQITSVTIDSVNILTGPIAHTGNNATTAAAVATAINSLSSSPDYTAVASGQTVIATAATAGTTPNGKAIVVVVGGTATVGNFQNMSGGANVATSTVADIKVNGVSIINAPVLWATSNSNTASLIASAINSYTSSPDYVATAVDDQVNIIASSVGIASNGFAVAFSLSNGMIFSPASGLVMAGGSTAANTYAPGLFVRTFGSKMYALSGPVLHFSGIQNPTKYTPDVVGAGFIDMSSQASGSEQLVAVAPYQGQLAVFAQEGVQIEYVDPDPANNKLVQELNNTGAVSGRSVTQFGDSDLFYLSQSGLRSLRARDASNAASTTDIGVPVDTLIVDAIRGLDDTERAKIIGLIEPQDGRFWLIIRDTIFVFSYFSGAKVSAWSVYKPGFVIDYALTFKRRVYARSENIIYVYGGLGDDTVYDDTPAIARLPYLDANKPTQEKHWQGYDAAVSGTWKISIGTRYDDLDVVEEVGIITKTTFNGPRNPADGASTHISLLFESQGVGPHKLGSAVIHHDLDDAED